MHNVYISRSEWGAQHEAGVAARALPCTEAWLHHTVTKHLGVDATFEEECAQMRVIEAIGESRFGYGFSYNLAGFPSGRMYVGCGVRRIGSHTSKRNTRALGIVLAGNYEINPVSVKLQDAIVGTLRDAKDEGWLVQPKLDGGHRDLKDTACPGDFAYGLIPALNHRAALPFDELLPPQEDGMFELLQTIEPNPKLYAFSSSKIFHIPTMEVFWAMVACGSFANTDAAGNVVARKVRQVDVDRVSTVVNYA